MRKLLLLCVLTFSVYVSAYDFMVSGIRYNILSAENKTVEVTYDHQTGAAHYGEYEGNIVVPSEVTYNNITFKVTQIGNYAFKYCRKLKSVKVEEGVTSIGYEAISSGSVTKIHLPNSVNTISEWSLSGNWYLTSVHLPENIEVLPKYLFSVDKALKTVELPENIKEISLGCFDSCEGLISINIPSKVHTIKSCSFIGCKNLASIVIPKNVTTIESSAFSGCSSLKEIHFHRSDIKCGNNAFNDCSSLKSIFVHDTNVFDANLVFSAGTFMLATLYVPKGTKSLYQNANGWKNFSNIEEFDDAAGISVIVPDKPYEKESYYYDLNGIKHCSPSGKGVYIRKGKKYTF